MQFAAQVLQLFDQFERQCDAGEIDFEIPLEPQREPRAAQGGAGEMPFGGAVSTTLEHSLLDEFHDVPLIDGAHAAQVLDA